MAKRTPKNKKNPVIDGREIVGQFPPCASMMKDEPVTFVPIAPLTTDFGREDMNQLRDKINEIIEKDNLVEHGRVIARAMDELRVQKKKNMAMAEKRRATMLEQAAEKALSGSN